MQVEKAGKLKEQVGAVAQNWIDRKGVMKRGLLLTCVASCFSTLPVVADMLGIKAGVDVWSSSDFGEVANGYLYFEHFIPLVPNIAVRASRVNNTLEVNTYDLYGYYELLDMNSLSLDLGVGLRRLNDGKLHGQNFSDTLPMMMADLSLFSDGNITLYTRLDAGRASDVSFYEWDIGARFNWIAGIGLQAGYRNYSLDFKGISTLTSNESVGGPHLGIHFGW